MRGTCAVDAAVGCTGEIFQFAQTLTQPIDAIVSGHSHTALDTQVRGIPIVQARSSARAIAVLDIPLDPPPGARVPSAEVRPVFTDSLPGIRAIDSMVTRWRNAIASQVNRPVARFATAMPKGTGQYPLGNYVADAQRWAAKADVAVITTAVSAPTWWQGGDLRTLFEIPPFATCCIAHRFRVRIAEYLERWSPADVQRTVSGVVVRYDPTKPAGSRLWT